MANQNVKFFFTNDINKYQSLGIKDPLALYFIEDTATGFCGLYKGENLIAAGSEATEVAAGLLSAEDYAQLQKLIAAGPAATLTPVDGTISIVDGKIGVQVSKTKGNLVEVKDDGLFVHAADEVSIPEYAIEKQDTAEDGYAASYRLKKTVDGVSTYEGDTINIAKDMVLQGATLETVTEANVPYDGAVIGDPYIDMVFNDAAESHIYIPVSGLVDTYTAGDGIEIVNNKISVKIAAESNGLTAVDGALTMQLATTMSAGAMSKEDKASLDNLKEGLKAIEDAVLAIPAPNAEQFTVENGVFTLKDISADNIMYNGKKLSDIISNQENSYTWSELGSETSVDLASEDAASVIGTAEDNSVVILNSGSVASALNVTSSVTIEGVNAGVAQNFDQEV